MNPFVITCLFHADAATVFNMWIDPGQFARWLGPEGAEMIFMTTEVKEGGTSKWSMTTSDGQTKYGQINYKRIEPGKLLVYTQNFCDEDGNFIKAPFSNTYPDFLLTTVQFTKAGENKTEVIVRWDIYGTATEEEKTTFNDMKPIMKTGWTQSFIKLEGILNNG